MPDPVAVNSMFGRIARRYDLANHLLSFGLDIWWRRRLVAAVRRHSPRDVLDLATGSGDVAFALNRGLSAGTRITGMDFCAPMLEEAERKKAVLPPDRQALVTFRQGDGMALPVADESFDAVTISFGLRNMADRHRSLTEMRRVLRPGGRLYVLEFSQPWAVVKPCYFLYLRHLLPRIAGVVTGDKGAYVYLNETIEEFPGRSALAEEIRSAGFADVQAEGLSGGTVALHSATR
ncbi:MAG: bifunctional demethylmenaquinone methyltransferase/2-methoxy-6-polyprenyl-1,4-benzoquinol methylase UbiE [Verrucomicrobia bacterium]|nr:bifunctional demethylmenaquinone methyltransferase/2-methoxy-6-polyprenyl-1,4-benzoquinol methylase UbiE [Verrucomicrobiota bacterium]